MVSNNFLPIWSSIVLVPVPFLQRQNAPRTHKTVSFTHATTQSLEKRTLGWGHYADDVTSELRSWRWNRKKSEVFGWTRSRILNDAGGGSRIFFIRLRKSNWIILYIVLQIRCPNSCLL